MAGSGSGPFRVWARFREIRASRLWATWLILVGMLIPVSVLAPRPIVVNLAGSTTIGLDLMPKLVLAYLASEKAHGIETALGDDKRDQVITGTFPGDWQPTTFVIRPHGTHTAFDPGARDLDIGMASRQITSDEANDLRARGVKRDGAGENVIGVDGVAIVTNGVPHLRALSTDEVRDIFTCRVTDWSAFTDPPSPGPIHVVAIRGGDSGTYDIFKEKVLGDDLPCDDKQATKLDDGAKVAEAVNKTVGAVGFVSLPLAKGLDAAWIYRGDSEPNKPSKYTVKHEDYVLYRRLYLYLFPEPAPSTRATGLIDYVQSDEGQEIVDAEGFAARSKDYKSDGPEATEKPPSKNPAAPGSSPPPAPASAEVSGTGTPPSCSDPPPEYASRVLNATRTTTVRFVSGSVVLDTRAGQDLHDLINGLPRPSSSVFLAGFADSNGDEDLNERISRDRALAVKTVLVDAGIVPEVKWFGEKCPSDTNATDDGRFHNRRVEIWIKD